MTIWRKGVAVPTLFNEAPVRPGSARAKRSLPWARGKLAFRTPKVKIARPLASSGRAGAGSPRLLFDLARRNIDRIAGLVVDD